MGFNHDQMSFLDKCFFVLFIIFITKDSFYYYMSHSIRTICLLFICCYYLAQLIIMCLYQKKRLYWGNGIKLILLLILASSLWSNNIFHSLKLSIINIVLPSIVVIIIVNKYRILTVLKMTFLAGALMAICSYIIVYLNPNYGIMTDNYFLGLWRGIFAHKNLLSIFSSFHLLISVFLLFYERGIFKRILYLVVAILHFFLLLFSGSSTGLVALFISFVIPLLLVFIFKINNKNLLISCLTFYLIIFNILVYFLIISLDNIVQIFGKDLTFTGRTIIWDAVINMVIERPFFGYGYGSFWKEDSFTFNYVNQYVPWSDLHFQAHNGFLDILTSIGFIGLILIICTLLLYIKRNITLVIETRNKILLFPLFYLVFFVVYNFQESFFLEQNFILWVFYLYFYTIFSAYSRKVNCD